MMKNNKLALLALIPLTLSATACSEIDAVELQGVKQAAAESERAATIASFFNNPIEIGSAVTTSYDSNTYEITDQVSSSARNTLTVRTTDGRVLERESYVKSSSGYAVREYLSISNTIKQETSEYDFSLYYGSPFEGMTSSNVTSYFDVEATSSGYTYAMNTLGVGKYNQMLVTFFAVHDDYVWDDYSYAYTVKNFNILTDEDGNPQSMDFYVTKTDRFGGIWEHYSSTLTAIEACESLTSYEAQSDATHAAALNNAISSLSSKLANSCGNFTEDFVWTVGNTVTEYSNYYDLFYTIYDDDSLYNSDDDSYGIMLSNNPLIDSDYGTTYTGLAWGYVSSTDSSYNTTYTYGYYYLGVSPDEDYYSFLSSDCYQTLVEVLPLIGDLSGDFFTYDSESNTYEWDLENFTYRSYESSMAIIYALFGVGDYCSAYQSNYVWDLDAVEFNFQNLSIALDESGEISTMTLDYVNYNDVECSTTVSFKNFGTTVLENDPAIKTCLEVMGAL